ncbi:F-box/FBD/LRR-repeat protein At1g13570-like [Bidens hawaiensis]|uniref:F-box/FBD/LRR-repeat protein At1g13570-like n=1 Tax=Bidens hawaiensis TaxID=980011 RepID=UPI0040497EE6
MKAKRLSNAQQLDIITTLPQPIIETILTLLIIEEAARTSILSREWRYKWTTIPKLDFWYSIGYKPSEEEPRDWWNHVSRLEYDRRRKDIRCKHFWAIHQILLLRQGPIHEFSLSLNAEESYFEIDQIILHLSRYHSVKKLAFYFYDPSRYRLPLSFFSLRQLTDLDLEYCIINHGPIFNGFDSLTRLYLGFVRISKETLLHLLSTCPSLKIFSLILFEEDFLGDEKPSIMELLKCLPAIEHLTTWGHTISSLVQASVPEEPPTSLIHLKYVFIRYMFFSDAYGLPFLAVLIKCCPKLEKLKIVIADYPDDDSVESEDNSNILEKYFDVWLEHLNELDIGEYSNLELELDFVKCILARSPNMKKVILRTYIDSENEKLELLKSLLCAPRPPCASLVEIVFRNPLPDD